jgi:hypothetical protein
MFSMITNIYNKKTKGPTLMVLFTATRKLKKIFFKLETIDVCTTGNTALIETIFKFWLHTRVNMGASIFDALEYRVDVCRVTRGAHIEHL